VGGLLSFMPLGFVSDGIEGMRLQRRHVPESFCLAGFSFLALVYPFWATAVRRFRSVRQADCFLRAGPGGLWARLPGRAAWSSLLLGYHVDEFAVPWSAVRDWCPFSFVGLLFGIPFVGERSIRVETDQGERLQLHTYFFAETPKQIAENMVRAARAGAAFAAELGRG
jgi:hypothetical protein